MMALRGAFGKSHGTFSSNLQLSYLPNGWSVRLQTFFCGTMTVLGCRSLEISIQQLYVEAHVNMCLACTVLLSVSRGSFVFSQMTATSPTTRSSSSTCAARRMLTWYASTLEMLLLLRVPLVVASGHLQQSSPHGKHKATLTA